METGHPTRIVILGAGFTGISEHFFVFQPLLPEVVSCSLEPGHVLNPIRLQCPHIHVHCATVTDVDLGQRRVSVIGRTSPHP